jgi:short-subunit dehydrogenase
MRLRGARILLTGASRGIGRPLARMLATRGGKLAIVGRDQATLGAVADEIGAVAGRVLPAAFDLASSTGHIELVRRVRTALGGIDLLINNAGTSSFESFEHESPANIARVVATNLLAPMLLTRAVLPYLSEGGRIVNIGSMFGSIGFPHLAAYSASKFGLRGFSEALRRELADRRIGVTYVAPRATRTDLNSAAMYQFARQTVTAIDAPEQVARAIVAAIERNAEEHYIGGPEPLFARLNALVPRLVDRALRKQSQIAREILEGEAIPPTQVLPLLHDR